MITELRNGVAVAHCRYAIVGTKDGHVQLFDLASSDMVEDHEEHEGAVWSLAVRPDGKGIVTGSADKTVKFWNVRGARWSQAR